MSGIKIGCCVNMLPEDGPSGVGYVADLAELGYDYIELPLRQIASLSETEFSLLKDRLRAYGLPCRCCNDFMPHQYQITGPEPTSREILTEYCRRAFARAGRGGLGALYVVFGSPWSRSCPEGFPMERAWEQIQEFLRYAADLAEEYGLSVAVENNNHAETNTLNTIPEVADMVRQVGRRNVGILCDYYHVRVEETPWEAVENNGQPILHTHIAKVQNRSYFTDVEGEEPHITEYAAILRKLNYTGGVSIEAKIPGRDAFVREARATLHTLRRVMNGEDISSTVLVTGFEPFGGREKNASWEAVSLLPDSMGGCRIVKVCLPVVFGKAGEMLVREVRRRNPSYVLLVGEAGGRERVTPETTARNRRADLADNDGYTPQAGEKVVEDGPEELKTNVDVAAILEQMRDFLVELSDDAGSYVCNDLFYTALHALRDTGVILDFVHVPCLPVLASRETAAVLERYLERVIAEYPAGRGDAMRIRKCLEEDIAAAGAFYDRVVLWLDRHINYPKWIYGIYPSERSVREMTAAGTQFLCEEGGKIVGAFVLNTDPQGNYQKGSWKKDIPDGSYMVLHSLAVDPDMYGRGIASEVIRFCETRAKAEGYKALRVDIVPDNFPARKLYEKNGFTWAGDVDLERGIEGIPIFSLYEKNWETEVSI